ncbi:MAG TPA: hypothetical protein VFW28_13015, partial [Micropepsaceae bacterium]|nr:hypothetical protein [Micropepsaceae bacterium]
RPLPHVQFPEMGLTQPGGASAMDAQITVPPVSDFLLLFAHLSLNGWRERRVAFASNASELPRELSKTFRRIRLMQFFARPRAAGWPGRFVPAHGKWSAVISA